MPELVVVENLDNIFLRVVLVAPEFTFWSLNLLYRKKRKAERSSSTVTTMVQARTVMNRTVLWKW